MTAPISIPFVREYAEGLPVEVYQHEDSGRWVVYALNEGGHNATAVDLFDLLGAIAKSVHSDLTRIVSDGGFSVALNGNDIQ